MRIHPLDSLANAWPDCDFTGCETIADMHEAIHNWRLTNDEEYAIIYALFK